MKTMKTALRTLEGGREEKGRCPRLGGRAPPPVRRIPLLNGAARCRTPGSGAGPSEQPSRNFRRCGFQPRRGGWKAGGERMEGRGAGGAAERWMESGKQAKRTMFSIISRRRGRRFRGGGILPRRGGWREDERLATRTPRGAGGMREESGRKLARSCGVAKVLPPHLQTALPLFRLHFLPRGICFLGSLKRHHPPCQPNGQLTTPAW